MHILIIDDDAAVRKFISTTLNREGHTTVEAENGVVGLEVLEHESQIDVLITDLIMPQKEGIETIMEAKRLYPSMKILAISGGGKVGPDNYLILADALGATATLKKPFGGKELILAIQNL